MTHVDYEACTTMQNIVQGAEWKFYKCFVKQIFFTNLKKHYKYKFDTLLSGREIYLEVTSYSSCNCVKYCMPAPNTQRMKKKIEIRCTLKNFCKQKFFRKR